MNLKEWWMPDAQQQAFRRILDAFARPGTLAELGSAEAPALLVYLSTVLDESVTMADPQAMLPQHQRRLLGAATATPGAAQFVVLDGTQEPDPGFQPYLGTLSAPEGGATLVLAVPSLGAGREAVAFTLRGPGIAGKASAWVSGLHPSWPQRRADWVRDFPLGVDLVLCAPRALLALPRTTRILTTAEEGR